jgi:hypothetical protein
VGEQLIDGQGGEFISEQVTDQQGGGFISEQVTDQQGGGFIWFWGFPWIIADCVAWSWMILPSSVWVDYLHVTGRIKFIVVQQYMNYNQEDLLTCSTNIRHLVCILMVYN